MNLARLQFKASVRPGWQAIDLGYLMATTWWRTLFIVAALPSLVVFIPLLIVFSDNPFWAGLIIWWLKPFWERLPLYFASRKIFSEQTTLSEVLLQTWSIYKKAAIPWLLWRRFSLRRAFNAPVTVLEGLTGESRRSRLNLLHGKYRGAAFANQEIGFCFELIFFFGIAYMIIFFIPDDFGSATDILTLTGEWFYTICWFIAMMLVLPFHTMAGFALYLNRRIELEAWDIEITFRNLAHRKQASINNTASSMLTVLLAIVLITGTSSGSYAAVNHDSSSAQQMIEQVLDGEDFGQEKTVRQWHFKNPTDGLPNDSAAWLKIMLIAGFILLVVYRLYRFRGPLMKLGHGKKTGSAPDVMFGLNVSLESLPDDIPAQVMLFWHNNRHRDALGLLYRASLSRLIDQHALAFKSSHTEAECVALVKTHGINSLSSYFTGLTRVWCHLAYGHELPELDTLEKLCDGWSEELSDAL